MRNALEAAQPRLYDTFGFGSNKCWKLALLSSQRVTGMFSVDCAAMYDDYS